MWRPIFVLLTFAVCPDGSARSWALWINWSAYSRWELDQLDVSYRSLIWSHSTGAHVCLSVREPYATSVNCVKLSTRSWFVLAPGICAAQLYYYYYYYYYLCWRIFIKMFHSRIIMHYSRRWFKLDCGAVRQHLSLYWPNISVYGHAGSLIWGGWVYIRVIYDMSNYSTVIVHSEV